MPLLPQLLLLRLLNLEAACTKLLRGQGIHHGLVRPACLLSQRLLLLLLLSLQPSLLPRGWRLLLRSLGLLLLQLLVLEVGQHSLQPGLLPLLLQTSSNSLLLAVHLAHALQPALLLPQPTNAHPLLLSSQRHALSQGSLRLLGQALRHRRAHGLQIVVGGRLESVKVKFLSHWHITCQSPVSPQIRLLLTV